MDSARIAALLQPFLKYPLSARQLEQTSTYIDLLLRWNARTNLTAIRDPEEIVTRHFGESLFTAQILFPPASNSDRHLSGQSMHAPTDTPKELSAHAPALNRPRDLVDVGSGAGFPGLPIHLWTPALQTTLIESHQKKVAFLREVIRALTLTGIDVSAVRAEHFNAAGRTVMLRAVERFENVLPAAAKIVAPAGRLALLIAEGQSPVARSVLAGLQWHEAIPVPNSHARFLLIGTAPL